MTPSSGSTGVGTSRRRRASNASRWVTPHCHASLGGGPGQATRAGGSRLTWRRRRASNANSWVTPHEAQGKQREQVGHASLSRLTWRRRRASNASRWVTPQCHASRGSGQATRAGGSRLTVTPHLEEAQGKQREQVGHALLSSLAVIPHLVTPHLSCLTRLASLVIERSHALLSRLSCHASVVMLQLLASSLSCLSCHALPSRLSCHASVVMPQLSCLSCHANKQQ